MNIGDNVRFLNSTGGGRVVRFDGPLAYVEDEDGFEVPVLQKECVVVGDASAAKKDAGASKGKGIPAPEPKPAAIASVPVPAPEPIPVEEVEGGDKLNLVMAFTASDLKRLSDTSTSYDCFLVNDSNYFIDYAIASRPDEREEWTLLARGIIEPNIQEFVAEITREMLPDMDRIAIQYLSYKETKPFPLKAPGMIERPLDTTKFFKLHCFRPSDFFDEPVIELQLITDDRPAGRAIEPDPEEIRRGMLAKKREDMRRPRPVGRRSQPKAAPGEPIVTDLHITELLDSTRGLSNADMLNVQIDRFREVMDANIKNKGQKLIFIHGKGEGVLRKAILKELGYRYKGNDVQDASFREYGFGATQVTIK